MTDFYGLGPRKRLGHKSEHICYYCQIDKHQDCEGKKISYKRDKAEM
jgi:hypothetical protein